MECSECLDRLTKRFFIRDNQNDIKHKSYHEQEKVYLEKFDNEVKEILKIKE
jgi:hypothetical protein